MVFACVAVVKWQSSLLCMLALPAPARGKVYAAWLKCKTSMYRYDMTAVCNLRVGDKTWYSLNWQTHAMFCMHCTICEAGKLCPYLICSATCGGRMEGSCRVGAVTTALVEGSASLPARAALETGSSLSKRDTACNKPVHC